MQTEAIFNNISKSILHEIATAQHSVYVAVAWFTNKNIFELLVNKASNGVQVYLMLIDDSINENSYINYEELNINTSRVFFVGNSDEDLMHNKFCVVDYKTVITGSYNWSYKAEYNFENIIITKDDTALAIQFIKEFKRIKNIFHPEEKEIAADFDFPVIKIIKRLEILENLFLLEDFEDINTTTNKLENYVFNTDIKEIVKDVRSKRFASAVVRIQNFIGKYKQLNIWQDNELEALKLEIKILENKLNAFDNEKIEMEKLLSDFQYRHSIELGEIILEILKLRKLKFKDDKEKLEEAQQDEKEYKEQYKEETEKKVFELSKEKQTELKKKFRKATLLCHPDKVNDKFMAQAKDKFIELRNAYENNDLEKVTEILNDLQNGNFKLKSEMIDEKDLLKITIAQYITKIQRIKEEIIEIKESDTFQQISQIKNWNIYFEKMKFQLLKKRNKIKVEIVH